MPGIKIGTGQTEIKLDLFFDLQCSYSKKAWDVVGHSVENSWADQLNIYFHPICLSHHRQSWDLTRALFAVKSLDASEAVEFIERVYSDHGQFYNAQWKSKTQDEFLSHLASITGKCANVSEKDFIGTIESDEVYANSKGSIHYAAVKQVWSTPSV
ncbi:DsbA family protein [Pseudomonadota bacterium]